MKRLVIALLLVLLSGGLSFAGQYTLGDNGYYFDGAGKAYTRSTVDNGYWSWNGWREDGKNHLFHEPLIVGKRGEVIGAYAVIVLPDGDWRYEWMEFSELARIRSRSKASNGGPWVTDTREMQKKTVLKRGLKTYCEDPAIVRALELDDREYEEEPEKPGQGTQSPPEGRVSLRAPATSSHEPLPVGNGNGHHADDEGEQEQSKPTAAKAQSNHDADDIPENEQDRRAFFERYDMAETSDQAMEINAEVVARAQEKSYGPRWVASFADKQAETVRRIEGR